MVWSGKSVFFLQLFPLFLSHFTLCLKLCSWKHLECESYNWNLTQSQNFLPRWPIHFVSAFGIILFWIGFTWLSPLATEQKLICVLKHHNLMLTQFPWVKISENVTLPFYIFFLSHFSEYRRMDENYILTSNGLT